MAPTVARACVAALLMLAGGCAVLPPLSGRQASTALPAAADTRLGRALSAPAADHPGLSGVHLLGNGRDAFAARVLLANAAQRSIDAQYYILRNDVTGGLFCEALWRAAERGVRVRLLLDDTNTKGLDAALATLDAHPNIEVRLFNPFAWRRARIAQMLTDFGRLNRRMHNKSFTVDSVASVVGGRNVGDEYFGAGEGTDLVDLDAVVTGAVVREVSSQFDAYWNSASAYPAASLIDASPATAAQVYDAWSRLRERPEAARYVEALRVTPLVEKLLTGDLRLEWARASVVVDDPAKVVQPEERTELHLLPRLQQALGAPRREVVLVSPYFVPTEAGTVALAAMAARGVQVRILTNSLASTDVAPVHSGYARYREALLRGGVKLYELKPDRRVKSDDDAHDHDATSPGSNAGLHAKTFAVDRERIFVGSFNFDPRSARLNTEMGIVIESVPVTAQLLEVFERDIARIAFEVRIVDGALVWVESTAAGEVRYSSEPGASLARRLGVEILSILPIEWLL